MQWIFVSSRHTESEGWFCPCTYTIFIRNILQNAIISKDGFPSVDYVNANPSFYFLIILPTLQFFPWPRTYFSCIFTCTHMQSSKERCSYCQSLSAFVIQSAVLYWLLPNAQCFTYAPVPLFFKERRDFILHHQHLYVSITIYLSLYQSIIYHIYLSLSIFYHLSTIYVTFNKIINYTTNIVFITIIYLSKVFKYTKR